MALRCLGSFAGQGAPPRQLFELTCATQVPLVDVGALAGIMLPALVGMAIVLPPTCTARGLVTTVQRGSVLLAQSG